MMSFQTKISNYFVGLLMLEENHLVNFYNKYFLLLEHIHG